MLPAASRVRTPAEHRLVARRGRRGVHGPLSARVLLTGAGPGASTGGAPRAGVVVPKAVGGAVVRNRVKRQLRHLLAARIVDLPWGSSVVVRAEAGSAGLSSAELAGHLDAALAAAVNRTAVDRPAVNRMAPR